VKPIATTVEVRLATTADAPALVALLAAVYADAGFTLDRVSAAAAFDQLPANPALGGAWLARADDTQVEVARTNTAALTLYARFGLHPLTDDRVLAVGRIE